ncbi:hypothetical protein [Terrarubrum flagellatum]|uniref:hypothetical protein n=1 Tax=Terrirubrum flagellatum TaxID=2895980 RepID=UPI003145088A
MATAEGPDDVWIASITAALLARGRMIHGAAMGVTAATLVIALLTGGVSARLSLASLAAAAVFFCAALEFWLAARVAFDAELFAALARRNDLAGFDRAMTTLGLMKSGKTGRAMAERAQGARRLLRMQALAFVALLVVAIGGWILIAWRL